MKIKISKVDKLFSQYIRERDGWKCQRCGTYYQPPTMALHCSHFWGRSNKCTRFDTENCMTLCYGCHSRMEGNKQGEYRDIMLKRLGDKGYRNLEIRARMTCSERDECQKALIWLNFDKDATSTSK